MDRIFCIDKPKGWTSFDVVAKLRGIIGQRKVGHGGTLDPMATGVLPIYAGKASRVCDMLPRDDKRYTATIRFGIKTDTLDITGTVTDTDSVPVREEDIKRVLSRFTGTFSQIPPMYSAVQVGGRRLYDLARSGEEVERKPRQVTVFSAQLLSCSEENRECVVDVHCSKGTYIRSLCDDIGTALGTFGTLTELRRTGSGMFTLEDTCTLEQMQAFAREGTLEQHGFSVDSVFSNYPVLCLNSRDSIRFMSGAPVDTASLGGNLRVYSEEEIFLGIGYTIDGQLKVRKLFAQRG